MNYKIEEILAEETKDLPTTEIKIINAAIKKFSEKGYHSTKTKDIADEAKIAEGTIFRYFKTKEDMLIKLYPLAAKIILPRLVKDLVKKIGSYEQLTPSHFASLIIEDRIELFKKNYQLFRALIPEILFRKELAQDFIHLVYPTIQSTLRQMIQKHALLPKSLSEEMLEQFIFKTIISYLTIGMLREDYLFREDLGSDIEHYVESILDGERKECDV